MSREQIDALIDRYDAGAEVLAYAVQGLTPEQERSRVAPGAWCVAELVAHLLDCDLVYAERMKRLIAEENPTLQAFDENAWLERLGSRSMPAGEAVALFAANRRWMTRILRGLPEEDFARSGTHTELGRKTLADVVATMANHVDHHLKYLYGKRANLGVSLYPRYSRSPEE
jgi:uncharacterized damage-inducible protein DinB